MISNQDRSGYFGASDTSMIVARNRETKSFKQWWSVKMGDMENVFKGNINTEMGNKYEHPILLALNDKMNTDRQIIIEKIKLRVNYDGDFDGIIYEVKTHKNTNEFVVTDRYRKQCQTEMFAYKQMQEELGLPPFKKLYIASYGLNPDEYNLKSDVEIDPNRIMLHEIKYDKTFVKVDLLPNLKQLTRFLKRGKFPH